MRDIEKDLKKDDTGLSGLDENKKAKAKTSKELYNEVLELIRKHTRNMSDDEAYKFHELLKSWTNKLI
jgi:hypothetical protein